MANKQNNKIFNIVSAVVFILAIAILMAVALPLIKNYDNPDAFKAYIESLGPWGIVMMFFVQIAQIVVALIPGEVVEFLAGTLYGWLGGLLFCLIGIAVGQAIIFTMVRILGRSFVEKVAGSDKLNKYKFLQDEKKLKRIIFILFFIPGTPKDAITYIVPLTKINLRSFLLLTIPARIPSIITSTMAGDALVSSGIETTVVIYLVIGAISLCGALFYKWWEKKHSEE